MGLLNKVSTDEVFVTSSVEDTRKEKSSYVGLLKKSILLSQSMKLDFFSFIKKYNFSYCALFSQLENHFVVENSFGFDWDSLKNSISTKDFWKGIILEQSKFYSFSNTDASIKPFYQFFSINFTNNNEINFIYIIQFNENRILFIPSEKLIPENQLNNIKKDLENLISSETNITDNSNENLSFNKIDFSKPNYVYKISFNSIISEIIKNDISSKEEYLIYKNILELSLKNSIYNLLYSCCDNKNIFIHQKSDYFLLIISEKIEFNDKLLKKHFNLLLKNHIGGSQINEITSDDCNSFSFDFLQTIFSSDELKEL